MKNMDLEKIKRGVALVLEGIGEDVGSQRLKETPQRAAAMFAEVLSGTGKEPADFLKCLTEEKHDEMVILRNIPFYSMCEHHFLPFHGQAHVGYVPDGRVVGISKIARVVEGFARRPQIQEQLTSQVAEAIMDTLQPDGVAVVIEAEHLCMTMRGARASGAQTRTSALRGTMRSDARARAEAISLLTK